MQKYNLISVVRRKKYHYYSQALHKYPNLFNRDFSLKDQIRNGLPIFHIYTLSRADCIFPSLGICLITVLLPTKQVQLRMYNLFWKQSRRLRERKRSPQSCSSTVTKAFNTHLIRILS